MDNRYGNFNNPPGPNETAEREPVFSEVKRRIRFFLMFHWNEFKYALCGLIIAVLFLTLGFWRTILILLLYTIGKALGQLKDGNPKILYWLDKLFTRY